MDDQLNVPLEDAELLAEVEMTTNLIIAASETEASLPQSEVDRLLGLEGPDSAGADLSDDVAAASIPPQKARHSA